MTMIRALISDLDGTLAPTEPLWPLIDQQFFSEQIGNEAWQIWNPSWLQMRAEGRQLNEILGRCITAHTLSLSVADLKQLREAFLLKTYKAVLKPFDGARTLLEQARVGGIKTVIASGMSPEIIRGTIALFGWKVDAISSTHEVEFNKPDPGVYRLACKRLQVDPAEAIAIENEWKGYLSAKAAGILTCHFIPDTDERERQAFEHGVHRTDANLNSVLNRLTALV